MDIDRSSVDIHAEYPWIIFGYPWIIHGYPWIMDIHVSFMGSHGYPHAFVGGDHPVRLVMLILMALFTYTIYVKTIPKIFQTHSNIFHIFYIWGWLVGQDPLDIDT